MKASLASNKAMSTYVAQAFPQPKYEDRKNCTTSSPEAIKQLTFLLPQTKTPRELHDKTYEHLQHKSTAK